MTMREVSAWVLEPLQLPFMQTAFLAVLIVGCVCACVGIFVVLRGYAFLGDALAHAMLPGVAVGYVVHGGARGPLFWWALFAAVLASLGVGLLGRRGSVRPDTAVGVVFAGMLALGIALISSMRNYATDLTHILFGNLLAVEGPDLIRTGVLGALVLLLLGLFRKELIVLAFDPILAQTLRLPVRFLHHLLLVLMAVCIVAALQTVGVGLMMAFLVTPAAAALLVTRRLSHATWMAAAIAACSGIVGLYLSYYAGIAPGASVVLVCTAIFGIAFIVTTLRRRVSRTDSTG